MLARVKQLETCSRDMFGDVVVTCQATPKSLLPKIEPYVPAIIFENSTTKTIKWTGGENEKRRTSLLVDQLLSEIYAKIGNEGGNNSNSVSDCNSATSSKSCGVRRMDEKLLWEKDISELHSLITDLTNRIQREGRSNLLKHLRRRDALRRQRDSHCNTVTRRLHSLVPENSSEMRFSVDPAPGESGFSQWASAMRMVAQLPGGIPPEFRKKLWLQLADRFLLSKRVDWPTVERNCFSEWSHPADAELGVQIVKDLHRTGCSLFCGVEGQENQALLKRVLLAYARWNKAVGYCQGFNMLAALLLQVTDKNESDALKLMIYLIEGVLPDSYFADSLRGLSVDMAVFRDLLKAKLPRLARHLDALQSAAKDGTTSYEPPLTNVFTMQWFLTLFCNCLPQSTVLRVWDLIFLDGNEILLRTALAIWQLLAERILTVRSADEFYCIMGVLTREMLEFGLVEPNALIKVIVGIGPLTELKALRDHYLYNINPWGSLGEDKQLKLYPKERLVLDISALKKQYVKLKQRQRQAHIIFSAAVSRQPPPSAPVAMNHLLLGKSALVPTRRIGPPKGAIPPARQAPPTTLHWKDAPRSPSSSSSSDTELCDDDEDGHSSEEDNPALMNTDNTRENGATTTNQNDASDIFDTASTSDFDFEKFLEENAGESSRSSRRNSQAMKIIEENSLILQRILQCQNRLTPSPPPAPEQPLPSSSAETPSDRTNFSTEFLTHEFDRNLKLSNTDGSIAQKASISEEEQQPPEPGSKYSSILEYSKNLNERYNALILNSPVKSLKGSVAAVSQEETATAGAFNPFPVKISSRQNKDVGLKLGLYKK